MWHSASALFRNHSSTMGGGVSTHVANAYGKPIYVKADAERRYLTMASFGVSGSAKGMFK